MIAGGIVTMVTKEPGPREFSILVRLSDREKQAVVREAGREPLGTFARRILLDYCERRAVTRKRKGD